MAGELAQDARAPRRGRPTGDAAREKLANILIAAQAQFMQLGYRAVTMRSVAEQAQVSTRTLYNHYSDKLSLFRACLEQGSVSFPEPMRGTGESLADALHRYAVELVGILSQETSLKLGMLVYRDGAEFPDMVAAAEDNQERHVLQPLARFLEHNGFGEDEAEAAAKLFLAMAIADWTRRMTFGHPMPDKASIDSHCRLATQVFLHGVSGADN